MSQNWKRKLLTAVKMALLLSLAVGFLALLVLLASGCFGILPSMKPVPDCW